jgi:uncharacterized damage-inducible protein DinB
MFSDPTTNRDPRTDPPNQGDERATLTGFLRWQRETLELKCAGLDATDLARRSVAPSTLSLLGLVRHMAEVERFWFRRVMAGQDAPPHFYSDADSDGDFDGSAPNLDITGNEQYRGAMSLRWVLVHMVEEYARHNGHADLLRERIDGAVGQ